MDSHATSRVSEPHPCRTRYRRNEFPGPENGLRKWAAWRHDVEVKSFAFPFLLAYEGRPWCANNNPYASVAETKPLVSVFQLASEVQICLPRLQLVGMSSRYEEPTPVVARLLGVDHTTTRSFGLGQWGVRCNSQIVRYGVSGCCLDSITSGCSCASTCVVLSVESPARAMPSVRWLFSSAGG